MLPQRSDEALGRQASTTRKGRTKPANLREQVNERTVGMWPTPRSSDGEHGGPNQRDSKGKYALAGAVHHSPSLWPTPQARDYRSADTEESPRGERKTEQGWSTDLNDAVKLWSTPTAVAYKGSGQYGSGSWAHDMDRGNLKAQVMEPANKGQLNPDWEETLMNLPVGWTDEDAENDDLYTLPHPAPFGCVQYDYEPPRVTGVKKNRAARVKAIGNAVSPTQIAPIFAAIVEIEQTLSV